MRQIEIPELKISYNLPGNLAECSEKEYLAVSFLAMQYLAGVITYDQFKVQGISKLLNIYVSQKFQGDDEILSNITMLSELMTSYFEPTENGKQKLNLNFIGTKVPVIKTIFRKFYGPEDSFSDVSYGEYADAVRLFLQYDQTGDIELLYLIAAIFYRPKKIFSKTKQVYDSSKIEKRAKHFKKYTSQNFIYGVFLQLVAFQQYLPTAEINWGNKILDFSILFEGDSENETVDSIPGIGVDSIVFTLAETNVFGDVKKVRDTNFWEIMVHMYDLRKRDLDNQKNKSNVTSK